MAITIVPGGLSAKYKYPVWQTVEQYKEAKGTDAPPFTSLLLGKFSPDMTLDVVSVATERERDAYIMAGYRKVIKPWIATVDSSAPYSSYKVLATAPDLHTLLLDKDGRPYLREMRIPAWLNPIYNMPIQDILRIPTEQNTVTIPTPLNDLASDERLKLFFNTAMVEKGTDDSAPSTGNGGGGDLVAIRAQLETIDAKVSLILAILSQK